MKNLFAGIPLTSLEHLVSVEAALKGTINHLASLAAKGLRKEMEENESFKKFLDLPTHENPKGEEKLFGERLFEDIFYLPGEGVGVAKDACFPVLKSEIKNTFGSLEEAKKVLDQMNECMSEVGKIELKYFGPMIIFHPKFHSLPTAL